MEDKMTVKELRSFLSGLDGCEDYVVKIGDGYLYRDEIGVDHLSKEVQIRGNKFYEDISVKATQLQNDVQKAISKFLWNDEIR